MNTNFTAKLLGSTFLLVAAMSTAEAAHLTPEQSLSRAQSASSIRRLPGNSSFTLAHTEKAAGESFLYVFNKGDNGFIVTSADDRMPALLGYSGNGSFNASEASPELKWWLGQYASQAEGVLKTESKMMKKSPSARAPKANVPELLSTRWDQDYPYNLDCPSDKRGQCVTGCVATAMAQVIKYYGYPINGNGSTSYTWNGETLSFDYSNANFDYKNMLDEYPRYADDYSQEQKEAVAKLMYACGVGVKMNYTSDSSGASDIYIAYALKEYFNYDQSIQYLLRDCFSDEEWDDIVYAELEAGRPVIYGGQSSGGGHEFICDGYEDGYYHINWGWSGYGNGWFLLSALDPGVQGIGGGDGGYDYDQSIICGVQPNAGNPGISYPLYASGGLFAYGVGNSNGEEVLNVGIADDGGVWNYSPEEINTSFYLKAVSDSGDEYVSSEGYDMTFSGAKDGSMSGKSIIYMYLPEAPEGTYKAYVEYMGPQGKLMPLMVPISGANYLNMKVDADGNVSFSDGDPDEKASVVVTEFSPASTIVSGEGVQLNLSIQNTGKVNYFGPIYMYTYNKGSEEIVDRLGINIGVASGKIFTGYINYTYELPDGEYEVRFYDMYDEPCSDVFNIVIGLQEVEVSSIELDITEKTVTEGESFTLTATVSPEDATDKNVTWTSSDDAVATVAEGVVTAVAPGTAIITASTSNGKTAACTLTVTEKVIEAAEIALDITEKTVTEGESFTLTVTVSPEDATDKRVTWTSSDDAVATVAEGVVTAVAPGTAIITASTSNGKTAACTLTVTEKVIEAAEIALDITEKTVTEGESFTLTATVSPEDATDKRVTWTSSDDAVATVADGIVTAVAPGAAIITASTSNGKTAACSVTVTEKVIEAAEITLDITEKTVTEGESFTLTATVSPEDATDKRVIWTSSDDAVATVADGIVTAVTPGTAIITASTSNGKTAACSVTVEKKFIYATSIYLDKTSIEVEVGETVMLVATVLPDDATEKSVAWSSTDESVATVDQEGKVTIVSEGIATIIAATTDGSDLQAECVVSGVSNVEAIVIEAGNVDIYTLDGILLRKNADASYVSNLAKGTYILRTPAQTLKLVK